MDGVAAPGLAEVASAWWDVDVEPDVSWSADGRSFWLTADGVDERLLIVTFATAPDAPRAVGEALAAGLAGCDFPPTADRADARAVAATLRSRMGRAAPATD